MKKGVAFLPAVLSILIGILGDRGLLPGIPPVMAFRGVHVHDLTVPIGLTLSLLLFTAAALRERGVRLRQQTTDRHHRFLERLDHELKNPLNNILAAIGNMSGAPNATARLDAMHSIESQTKRLRRLVADMRVLTELRKERVKPIPVDIAGLLEEIHDLTKDRSEAADRKLAFMIPQAPSPLPRVEGDRELLLRAIQNLVDNALKYTRSGERVEVRAAPDGKYVRITVADTGPGIPESELPHIEEELFRGRAAKGIQGSGIGLALVRAIVELHNGHMDIHSRVGQGTDVNIRLLTVDR